ncbi:DUF1636 family protein [Leisingera methylohalidivorans]|uniref:Metal-binding protein n=1 Tax=Leisingera methylohalidivorans DSM 14336 TaxID=999552 RepID=V9VT16_9RHOB|nr:DUF1636 family protein [Leisingera methylohalidivorans]AHD00017.1 hypothetical protein METH_04220 [Leisingera methylohalidivorans DSM 14336]
MSLPTLTLCRTCRDADPALFGQVRAALEAAGVKAQLQQVDCMSGCKQPQTLAVRQCGKTAYLFGGITAEDLPDVLTFLRMYEGSRDGNFADARPLGNLRFKAVARIPADLD